MNHFFAIELSDTARSAVAALAANWRRDLAERPDVRWYDSADYHITLKFLGNIPPSAANCLAAGAAGIAAASTAFDIAGAAAGAFPDLLRPRVLWAGVAANDPLARLAAALDRVAATSGLPRELRPYRPHVTLARARGRPVGPPPVSDAFPTYPADRFVLMTTAPPSAERETDRVRYNIVQVFPFS